MSDFKVILLHFLLLTTLGVQSKSLKMFKELGETIKRDTKTGKEFLKTYYYSQNLELDWTSALSFCKVFNMNMATLETKEEHDYLLNLLDNGVVPDQQVFIGATDIGDEGNFYWVATGKTFDYSAKWKAGEPNNLGDGENCIGLWKEDGYRFNDVPCTGYKQKFLCELEEEIQELDPRVGEKKIK